jgi:hypothetical protein
LSFAAMVLLAGCAPEESLDEGVATDEIVGGRPDRGAHPAVLALSIAGRALCTGG